MSLPAVLVLSAAIVPALPPAAPVNGGPAGGAEHVAGAFSEAQPGPRRLPAKIGAIGAVVAEIVRSGTNAPGGAGDGLYRRVGGDSRGGTIEYE